MNQHTSPEASLDPPFNSNITIVNTASGIAYDLILPTPGHACWETFDYQRLCHVVRMHNPAIGDDATFSVAYASARRTMSNPTYVGYAAIFAVVLRANDDWELVRFGPKGSHRTLWNFTSGNPRTRIN